MRCCCASVMHLAAMPPAVKMCRCRAATQTSRGPVEQIRQLCLRRRASRSGISSERARRNRCSKLAGIGNSARRHADRDGARQFGRKPGGNGRRSEPCELLPRAIGPGLRPSSRRRVFPAAQSALQSCGRGGGGFVFRRSGEFHLRPVPLENAAEHPGDRCARAVVDFAISSWRPRSQA